MVWGGGIGSVGMAIYDDGGGGGIYCLILVMMIFRAEPSDRQEQKVG